MQFTAQQIEQYKSRYVQLAKRSVVKGGHLDFEDLWNGSRPLVNEIIKHSKMKEVITISGIFWLIKNSLDQLHQSHKDIGDFKFSEKISIGELDEAADKFINLLEGLPYEHFFYFRFPIKLPENLFLISLTNNVKIVRPKLAEKNSFVIPSPLSSLAEASLGKIPFSVDDNDVFFKVKTLGYGDPAQTSAITILKQFLYLVDASGLLTSKSWDRRDARLFENNRYQIPSIEGNDLQSFTLSSETALYISGLKLDNKKFEGFEPVKENESHTILGGLFGYKNFEDFFESKFIDGCRNFIKLQNEKKAVDRDHIFSAIEWGFDGNANPNETMGFIQICIGLEALLGDKDERKDQNQRGLTEKLADRCAYLLGNTPNERKKQADEFKKIYDLRSKLIHGVWPKVTDEQYETIMTAEYLLKCLVYKELWLSENLT